MRRPRRLAQPRAEERELRCRHQSACVSTAADLGWPGFSCAGCPGVELMSQLEHRQDYEGIAGLLRAISGAPMARAHAFAKGA